MNLPLQITLSLLAILSTIPDLCFSLKTFNFRKSYKQATKKIN